MFRILCRLLLRLSGWKLDSNLPKDIHKSIVIAAPHTSNWDFWYMILSFGIYGLRIRFTVKKEWMRFPFNLIMKPLGGIAIDRSPRKDGNRPSLVDAMVQYTRRNPKQTNCLENRFFSCSTKCQCPYTAGIRRL